MCTGGARKMKVRSARSAGIPAGQVSAAAEGGSNSYHGEGERGLNCGNLAHVAAKPPMTRTQ